jgi:(p)ppGpp synthase/HD superfamily hydrolase
MDLPPNETPKLGDRFEKALVYAAQLHARQIRKGSGTPYISHLLSVTALVLEDGGDEDEAIAALLHDAIEDRGGEPTRTEILYRFGDRVTRIIDGCTDATTVPKPPWQERKQQYLQKLAGATPEVVRVSVADKLHNARSLLADYQQVGDQVWQRFRGGKDGTLWFYQSLIQVYRTVSNSPMVDELAKIVAKLEHV